VKDVEIKDLGNDSDLQIDAETRDFSINCLYFELRSHTIIDPKEVYIIYYTSYKM
jgi:hypothetical protein